MFRKQRPAPAPASEPLGVLIAAARRGIKQATGVQLRGSGLSPQQFWILMAIHEHHGPSLRALCERRRIDAPTASRVVATLAAKDLVRVEGDPADRRRCCLELTAEGERLARRLEPQLERTRAAVAEGLSRDEQATLRDLLCRVIANAARLEQAEARRPRGRRAPQESR
ncbi:MAG: MarR family winged helix-turn-helix transcriptional regulator [Betaproteobacteria bacterium]